VHLQVQVLDVTIDESVGQGINWNLISKQSSGQFQISNNSKQVIDGFITGSDVSLTPIGNSNIWLIVNPNIALFAYSTGVQHTLNIRVTWRVSYKRQELLTTLRGHLSSPPVFDGVRLLVSSNVLTVSPFLL
jgi:hypothetical protein